MAGGPAFPVPGFPAGGPPTVKAPVWGPNASLRAAPVPTVPPDRGERASLADWREAGHESQYRPYDGKERRNELVDGPFTAPWQTAGVVGLNGESIAAQIVMRSPIFDFRPELGAPQGIDPGAVVPIWRANAFGQGARFFWQVYGVDRIAAGLYMHVYTRERIHLYDPLRMRSVSQWEDITSDFFATDGESTVLEWQPAGNPVRFWQVEMRFDQIEAGASPELYWDIALY